MAVQLTPTEDDLRPPRPPLMGGGPPFNDSEPCIACPTEIRALYDIAVMIITRARQTGQVQEENIDQLAKACMILKPHIDHHFLDTAHSVPPEILEEALRKANTDGLQN